MPTKGFEKRTIYVNEKHGLVFSKFRSHVTKLQWNTTRSSSCQRITQIPQLIHDHSSGNQPWELTCSEKFLINLKLLFTLVISNKKTCGQLNAKINLTSEIAHKKKQRKAKRKFKSLLF